MCPASTETYCKMEGQFALHADVPRDKSNIIVQLPTRIFIPAPLLH